MGKIRFYKKILIVKPSSLGDIVHSLPFLDAVRSCFPQSEIHWVIARGMEGILEGHPMIDRLIIINKDMWKKISKTGRTIKEAGNLLRTLKKENYDLVVDLQGLLRSGIITMATGAPFRVGFEEAREGSRVFYNRKVKGGKDIHAVDRYMKIADYLGCNTEKIIFPFPLMKNDLLQIKEIKRNLKEYIVIVPGARWETKKWPADKFGELAGRLSVKSVVIGSKADAGLAEKVMEASAGKAVSMAGNTNIRELMEIMRDARLVISNDSGPMHIAAGFNIPVVAIFGPTSPLRTGPYGDGHIIIKSDAECSPCFKKRCRDMKCMKEITVDYVHERIRDSVFI
ncbi:MAG: lipopolysaccharide heptosyltransferase I [Nitrospirota bacterium]